MSTNSYVTRASKAPAPFGRTPLLRAFAVLLIFGAALAPSIGSADNVAGPSGFTSTDFNDSTLGAQWTLVDPLGDAIGGTATTGAGTGQATLALGVPAGTAHDHFDTTTAPRLLQPINNVDFELEVGFVSMPTQRFQLQGLSVEQDAANWVRLDTYHDGTTVRVLGATTVADNTTIHFNDPVPAGTMFLRLTRVGDLWTGSYSTDGPGVDCRWLVHPRDGSRTGGHHGWKRWPQSGPYRDRRLHL